MENVICTQNVINKDSLRIDYVRTMLNKNSIGSRASDFLFYRKDGSESYLYDVKANYIMVYFNNPDCDTCEEEKRAIASSVVINNMLDSDKLKILSVCVEGETEKWKTQHLPEQWIDACDRLMMIIDNDLYYLPSLPVLYLLDNEHNVIMKNTTLEDIEVFLKGK